jgi:methylaspartate mutase epsilon subunit
VDCGDLLAEATALIGAVLEQSDDIGQALRKAFAAGLLDVPFCLHQDNRGLARGAIDAAGRLVWAETGKLPLPAASRSPGRTITSAGFLSMLHTVADRHDRLALSGHGTGTGAEAGTGGAPRPGLTRHAATSHT